MVLLIGAAAAVVALVAIIGYGWFTTSFQPPRKTVAEVSGEAVQLREVVPQTVMDLTRTGVAQPRASLGTLVRDRLLRLSAPTLGLSVSEEDLNRDLVELFETPVDPEADPPAVLTDEGQDLLDGLLENLGVDQDQYVEWREGILLDEATREHFAEQQPDVAKQVFLSWIVASSQRDIEDAMERVLGGEEFADVALDFDERGLDVESVYSAPNGEVGWTPGGAFPWLDQWLFDPELEQREPLGPIASSIGSVMFVVTDGPSEEPLTEEMRALTTETAFQTWINDQVSEIVSGDGLSDDDTQWVLREICDLPTPPIDCRLVG